MRQFVLLFGCQTELHDILPDIQHLPGKLGQPVILVFLDDFLQFRASRAADACQYIAL